jgi:hypothetical protein
MAGATFVNRTFEEVRAVNVTVTDDSLIVDLDDSRTISVPIGWFPRLLNGTQEERNQWRLVGRGIGIHWPSLDEDIGVEGLLLGKKSSEGPESFRRWLDGRTKAV